MGDLISDLSALEATCRRFTRAPRIALDTEAASFHRYVDRVYLIQLSTDEETVLIDPLAIDDLSPVGLLLGDSSLETIFHDADYDLRVLDRDYGFRAARIFDTRVVAQLAGEPAIGLSALLEKYLGVRLDKRFQRADWSVRPLPPDMLRYAADDTRYLPALRDVLARRLDELGRRAWADEEFDRLTMVRWTKDRNGDDAFLRIKGARTLPARGRAVLRELHAWREAVAQRLDRAPFRVVSNEALVGLARTQPSDAEQLAAVTGISRGQASRYGAEILDAIESGQRADLDTLPRTRRRRHPDRDPGYDARLERLRALRARRAEEVGLDPGLVCPNGTLQAIARAMPESDRDLDAVSELRRWQREVLGDTVLLKTAGR